MLDAFNERRLNKNFYEMYIKMIKVEETHEINSLVYKFIFEIESLWNQKYVEEPSRNIQELMGFYEEFKSTYNKLIYECQEENYENAYYAAYMIDKETLETIKPYLPNTIFPSMIINIKEMEFEELKTLCNKHEQILVDELKNSKIEIKAYKDIREFMNSYKF